MENLTWDQFESTGTSGLKSLDSMEIHDVSGGHGGKGCHEAKEVYDWLSIGWSVYKAMTGNG